MSNIDDDKIVITILGADKVGIVARISAILADCNVNIEDIKQSIMQNLFVMFMLAKTSEESVPFNELKDRLNEAAKEMKMEIWVQKKAIFDKMHTI